MPRWIWFLPLGVLVLAVGLLAYRMGVVAAHITETDVIETYSAHYVDTAGPPAKVTDCTARPGIDDRIWIVVRCVSSEDQVFVYPVDRLGRLLRLDPVMEDADAPNA